MLNTIKNFFNKYTNSINIDTKNKELILKVKNKDDFKVNFTYIKIYNNYLFVNINDICLTVDFNDFDIITLNNNFTIFKHN